MAEKKFIRVADYVFRRLAEHGVDRVFLVTGGGAMHLNDALGRQDRIRYICNHHEQASAMAAEGYARVSGKVGVACVTSGPGGVNALNGVLGAWTDSIPLLVISGQMKRETLLRTHKLSGKLRQLGDQEVDIVEMVRGITKYARVIMEPESIYHELDRALYLATHGRPGPVWLDIPVDVQAALIDPASEGAYDPEKEGDAIHWNTDVLRWQARDVMTRLLAAERPLLLGGTGVRLANAIPQFLELAERLEIPVCTAWTHDLIASDHPLFCGRQGSIGTRAGNFNVQNADFVLILGSRMCIRQVSYNWKSFARHAYTVQVDVDAAELDKPTFRAQQPIHADARVFLEMLLEALPQGYKQKPEHGQWLAWCRERMRRYPPVLPRQRIPKEGAINPYHFAELLFKAASKDAVFVCANASACIVPFQAGALQSGQRMFSNSGSASMGYDLPAAIGAAEAAPDRQIICLAGDGSLQMNVQELATVAKHRLPIKLFILDNGGYLSIRSTQSSFFKNFVGEGPESGVGFPDFTALAKAYGLEARVLDTDRPGQEIAEALAAPGPQVRIVKLDRNQEFEPKLSSRRLADGSMETPPLEDMAPFLDREEFRANMIVRDSE